MSPAKETFVIMGAGLAGGTAAASLRTEGFDGRVVLIGAEPHRPYNRPALSKGYLRGEESFDETAVKPTDFYAESGIETLFDTTVMNVDPSVRRVKLSSGNDLGYDKLLIASGSRNRHLALPGAELEGIYQLRTLEDADRIRKAARPGTRAVIVGMGFIGSEVAASLRHLGVDVTGIEGGRVPLQRALGEEIGAVVRDIHTDRGVKIISEDQVVRFDGDTHVRRVETREGRSIECEFVIVGVGVEPVTDAVSSAGLEISNGIVVDEYCRTNVEGIFAAGDVANHFHPVFGERMRVEHWNNAFKQSKVAARNMLGTPLPYDEIHSFWSDQYEYGIEYAGWHQDWDEIVVRGSLAERDFIAFYVKNGLVTASVGIDRVEDVQKSKALIKARRPIDPVLLRDETIDLEPVAA